MKKTNLAFALLGILIILNIVLFFILFQHFSILDVQSFSSAIVVSDKIGFNLDPEILHFGSVMPGGSASRQITIKNNFNFPIKVQISSKGDISDFVKKQSFLLDTGEEKKLKITASTDSDAELGEYKGKIIAIIKRNI